MKLFLNGVSQEVSLHELIKRASNVVKELILPEYGKYKPENLILKPVRGIVCCDGCGKKFWVTADDPDVVMQNNHTAYIPGVGVEHIRALFETPNLPFFIVQAGAFYPKYGIIPLLPLEELENYPAHTH